MEKEKIWKDREFWSRLRRMQRELVMKELKKEMIAVERRIMEELKKAEEAKARLEEEKARQIRKRKLKILFLVLVLIAVIIIIACLYAKGYLKF